MKKAAIVCISFAIALCSIGLFGCGQSSEDVIRGGISEELDMLKNMDDETLDLLMEDIPYDMQYTTQALGISVEDYFTAYFDGFDYKINDIDVNGDEATVNVTLFVKSASAMDDAVNDYVDSLTPQQLTEVQQGMMSGSAPAWFGEGFIQTIESIPNTQLDNILIRVTKEGNTWSYDDATQDIIEAALINS